MPDHQPVGLRRFVEQGGAERKGLGVQKLPRDRQHPRIARQGGDGRLRQEMTRAGATAIEIRLRQVVASAATSSDRQTSEKMP
jgi:hypothetical protein